jgi:hypothetical protein
MMIRAHLGSLRFNLRNSPAAFTLRSLPRLHRLPDELVKRIFGLDNLCTKTFQAIGEPPNLVVTELNLLLKPRF